MYVFAVHNPTHEFSIKTECYSLIIGSLTIKLKLFLLDEYPRNSITPNFMGYPNSFYLTSHCFSVLSNLLSSFLLSHI